MSSARAGHRPLCAALLLALSSFTTGCGVFLHGPGPAPGPGHGPPPHAPAHGRRAKYHHQGAELEFDPGLGAYIVVGRPGFYFMDDHYYRMVDGAWHMAVNVGGPWTVSSYEHVPPGLVKSHGKGKGKGKGKDKDKGKSKGKG